MVQHVIETQTVTAKFEGSPLVFCCSPFFLQDALDEEVSPCKCLFRVGRTFRLLLKSYFNVLRRNLLIYFVRFCPF